jgi:hypothetical protein
MGSIQDAIQHAEAQGHDPEAAIRQIVSQTVLEGVATGFDMATNGGRAPARDSADSAPSKRPKTGDGPE